MRAWFRFMHIPHRNCEKELCVRGHRDPLLFFLVSFLEDFNRDLDYGLNPDFSVLKDKARVVTYEEDGYVWGEGVFLSPESYTDIIFGFSLSPHDLEATYHLWICRFERPLHRALATELAFRIFSRIFRNRKSYDVENGIAEIEIEIIDTRDFEIRREILIYPKEE